MAVNKLELDEAQRDANYEAIKTNVKADVGGEITAQAARPTVAAQRHIDIVAEDIRNSTTCASRNGSS
jgi:hypothetical protein